MKNRSSTEDSLKSEEQKEFDPNYFSDEIASKLYISFFYEANKFSKIHSYKSSYAFYLDHVS